MASRGLIKISGSCLNIFITATLTQIFPEFLSNSYLRILTILNIFASICIHLTVLLLLVSLEQPIIVLLWDLCGGQNSPLAHIFIVGCIIHIVIIKNQFLAEII